MEACAGARFRRRNEYDFTIQELAEGADWSDHQGPDLSQRRTARSSPIPEREILVDMDKLPSVLPLYKQLKVERVFRRLSAAPLYVLVHGPRLQVALHLLPVAADHRRPQIPLHVDRPRGART